MDDRGESHQALSVLVHQEKANHVDDVMGWRRCQGTHPFWHDSFLLCESLTGLPYKGSWALAGCSDPCHYPSLAH